MRKQRQPLPIDKPKSQSIHIEIFGAGLHRITVQPNGFHVVIDKRENVLAFVAIALSEWIK